MRTRRWLSSSGTGTGTNGPEVAKNPDNMSADERLKRIRSLERKASDLDHRLDWAERQEASVRHWAEEAWEEVRHLRGIIDRLWDERNEYRKAAGLEPEPKYVTTAVFDKSRREWVSVQDVPPIDEWRTDGQ